MLFNAAKVLSAQSLGPSVTRLGRPSPNLPLPTGLLLSCGLRNAGQISLRWIPLRRKFNFNNECKITTMGHRPSLKHFCSNEIRSVAGTRAVGLRSLFHEYYIFRRWSIAPDDLQGNFPSPSPGKVLQSRRGERVSFYSGVNWAISKC